MTWRKVVGAKTLENARSASVKVGERVIYVAKVKGKLFAMDGVCTHAKCILDDLDEEGLRSKCRFHGAEFNITNGNMVVPPSISPNVEKSKLGLNIYPIREEGLFVEIDVD